MTPISNAAPEFRIRPATPEDARRIIELVNAAFAVEDFLEGTRTDPERLAVNMQKGTILLAEDERGELAASVYVEIRGSRGYIGMLAVDPARQGRGLASLLLRAAEDHMRSAGCEAVDITVLSLRPNFCPSIAASALWKTAQRSSPTGASSANPWIATASRWPNRSDCPKLSN